MNKMIEFRMMMITMVLITMKMVVMYIYEEDDADANDMDFQKTFAKCFSISQKASPDIFLITKNLNNCLLMFINHNKMTSKFT